MASNLVIKVRDDSGDKGGVAGATLRDGIATIQQEMGVSAQFSPEVEAAAAAAAAAPRLPDLDLKDLPFVTIDPASARDLDQAMFLERHGDGFRVHYAIADLGAFITPGDAVDLEANRRGETLYGADSKIPLHPTVISEDAGSLLPDQVRPAIVWHIDLDAAGEQTSVQVERALVRSRAKLSYVEVQDDLDAGTADEMFSILREVGELRLAREAERGGISLPLPEQEIVIEGDRWHLEFRELLPVESWNAQISLLTGFAAASMMLEARVGLLRTLPPADPRAVERLRRTARALRIEWPDDMPYPDFVRSLDPEQPHHAAMVVACTRLLRGSGYADFDGALPEQPLHSALAAEYAHVTAPLRRLVDRYALEICLAHSAGEPVPAWVLEAMPGIPDTMADSGRRANQYENAVLNLVEAAILAPRIGERFEAVVVEVDDKDETRGDATIEEPAIEARVTGSRPLPVGEHVTLTLTTADVATRKVELTLE